MPLLGVETSCLRLIKPTNFRVEKDLQNLIEKNLGTVFNCRFIASEFSTGIEHAGRIDSLALSEDGNPVILEYKKIESSELISQSLYYLAWLDDHRGDFEIAVKRKLGLQIEVDWSDIRVICIAPGFKKFDLYAVKKMGANIELWQYRLFENNTMYLEEIYRRSRAFLGNFDLSCEVKDPRMVAAGRKGAITRVSGTYTFEQHVTGVDEKIKMLAIELQDFILGLDESVVEVAPKKHYLAYKVAQNFVCMEVQKKKISLFLKLNPNDIKNLPPNARDVKNIGHYGTGDLELTLSSQEEVLTAHKFIRMAFERIGG